MSGLTNDDGNSGQGGGAVQQGSGGIATSSGSGGAATSVQGGQASLGMGGDSASLGMGGQSVAVAHGGTSASGGSGSGGSGGAVAGGGAGASAANASCTDVPPNNGDTCAHAVEYNWCKESWLGTSCQRSCGKCNSSGSGSGGASSSSNGGSSSTGSGGSTGSVEQPPRIDGGSNGWASRYWDCCKPACGWKANVPGNSTPVSSCNAQNQSLGGDYNARNACESGGSAYMCQNYSPWAVSDTLAYGFAAVSKGGDYCGKCYQLQFTGGSHNSSTDAGSQSLANKTLIVQAINNGGVGSDQFDLLIPGGGVGDFDACSSSWGSTDLGERYGGFFLACQKQNGFNYAAAKSCAQEKCKSVFASKPDLLAGCDWFTGWFGAPDNPALVYKEVTCPTAITSRSGLKR